MAKELIAFRRKNFKVQVRDLGHSSIYPDGYEKLLSVTHNGKSWMSIALSKEEAAQAIEVLAEWLDLSRVKIKTAPEGSYEALLYDLAKMLNCSETEASVKNTISAIKESNSVKSDLQNILTMLDDLKEKNDGMITSDIEDISYYIISCIAEQKGKSKT